MKNDIREVEGGENEISMSSSSCFTKLDDQQLDGGQEIFFFFVCFVFLIDQ